MRNLRRAALAAALAAPLALAGQQSAEAVQISQQTRSFGCLGLNCHADVLMTLYWRVQADGQGVRFDRASLNATEDCAHFEPSPSLDVTNVWIENGNGVKIWDGPNNDVGEPSCVSTWLGDPDDGSFVTVNTNTASFRVTFKARVNNGDDVTTTMTIAIHD